MHRYGSLFILLVLTTLFPHSQDASPIYLRYYAKAEKLYSSENATDKTDSIALSNFQLVIALLKDTHKNDTVLLSSYSRAGILSMTMNENKQALLYFGEAIRTASNNSNIKDSLLFPPYLYAGSIHYSINELDSAIWYYKKAELIAEHYPTVNESERLYNKLGALYFETGDYRKSIPYYQKALSVVIEKKSGNNNFIVNYKNNIAASLVRMGNYQAALDIYNDLFKYHINEDQLYFNISGTYLDQERPGEALQYLRLMQLNIPEKFNNLTRAFLKMKQLDSARTYNIHALQLFESTHNTLATGYGLALKYAGDVETMAGDVKKGLQYYQQAIIRLSPGFTDKNEAHNPTVFRSLQSFSFLFDALVSKGAAFQKQAMQNTGRQNIQDALAAYSSALALARYVARTYSSDDARLFLKNKVNPACSQAVALSLQLYKETGNAGYISAAFSFAENNKASVLQAAIQQPELSDIAGLPAQLIQGEKKYKALLAKLAIQLAQLRDSTAVTTMQKKISETELLLSGVQNKLDENPAYHLLKFNAREVRMDEIKKQLAGKDAAVLSYYYTANQLHCFYITAATAGVVSTPINNDFFTAITHMRSGLQAASGVDRKLLDTLSGQLYQSLLQPIINKIAGNKHLVIIPYNEISYLPFDVLKNEKDGSLVLNTFAVSYHYSANFLFDDDEASSIAYRVLAMAPFTDGNNNGFLPALPYAAREIEGLPGQQVSGTAATRAQFIALADKYPVLHLATHAVASDQNPAASYIAFYGNKTTPDSLCRLYEKEIYNLNMKSARLVILSACETGSGMLVNGEGIVSLSRAFSYAGCKSVITSLWKADDAATAFIIKQLHVYLQKGYAKDEALQKAKLDYLSSSETENRFKAPSFWAHLVLIGDHAPVVKAGFSWSFYGSLAAFLLLVAAFVYYKRKRVQ